MAMICSSPATEWNQISRPAKRSSATFERALERREPALVVAGGVPVRLGRRDLGAEAVAEGVPVVDLVVAQRDRHPEDAPLPGGREDQFAVLARYGQVVAQVFDAWVAHR